jgi:uncharacterized phage protein gp47/JayE
MPIVNGDYQQLTAEQIQETLETELQQEFGQDIDLTQSSVFTTLANVVASVTSQNQEQSLQEVYQSAFLDTATGIDLDRVVSIIGIQRRDAIHATGVQRFVASGPVAQDYTIQSGTVVQTDSDAPAQFETTEPTVLTLIDSFESQDLSVYAGDTGAASIVTDPDAVRGDYVLELDNTDGTHIYRDDAELQRGTTYHGWVDPSNSTAPALTFAVQPTNPQNYYQIVADGAANQVRLERVEDGSVAETIDTLSAAGIGGGYNEIEWDWSITTNIGITVYGPNGNELGTLGGADDTYLRGYSGFKSAGSNGSKRFDFYTTSAVSANIRAIVGGTGGNVGPNSITQLPSPPNGVDRTENLYPTASTDYVDTNGEVFAIGTERETDTELRARAEETVTGGGDATHDALVAELINETPGVSSVTIYENKTDNDNTGTGGLPPHSFEAVVFGGDDEDVAETIFDKKAITSRDYSGVRGTSVSTTVTSEVNGQQRTIEWSRPTEVDIDMSLDIIIDDTYVGDDSLRDDIVEYIGGELTNGSTVVGLGVGENVRVDRIRDIVVGSDTGVIGFDYSIDGTPLSFTPSSATIDGLEVIDVGPNEVGQTDATDASITINTREQ